MSFDILKNYFDRLSIAYQIYHHEPVFTMEDAEKLSKLPLIICKNLFLKDRKKRFWLVITHGSKKIEIKKLAKELLAPELRFVEAPLLYEMLQLTTGSVTPFGLLHDKEHQVTVVIDESLLSYPVLGFHPFINNATVGISPDDLLKILREFGNNIKITTLG